MHHKCGNLSRGSSLETQGTLMLELHVHRTSLICRQDFQMTAGTHGGPLELDHMV